MAAFLPIEADSMDGGIEFRRQEGMAADKRGPISGPERYLDCV